MNHLKAKLGIFACAFAMGVPSAFAQRPHDRLAPHGGGSGVGNGGTGERELIRKEISDKIRQSRSWEDWGVSASSILRAARGRANRFLLWGDWQTAESIIVDALFDLDNESDRDFDGDAPMVRELIHRGVLVWRSIDDLMRDENPPVSRYNFLDRFVDVVTYADEEFDHLYYSAHVGRGDCEESVLRRVEVARLRIAQDQLRFLTESFADSVIIDRRGERTPERRPLGNPRVFFEAAEILTGLVANDLRSSLFQGRFYLLASDLEILSRQLEVENRTSWYQTPSGRWVHSRTALSFGELWDGLDFAVKYLGERIPADGGRRTPDPDAGRQDGDYRILPIRK